jgi:hypothetical protein
MSVSNVSSVTAYGSAAIASPPANDPANVKRGGSPADSSAAPQTTQAAKPAGTGQFVDMTA